MEDSVAQHWRAFGSVAGLCGGMLCALLGSGLTALSWFVSEPHNQQLLHSLGGGTLCLTIPLLLVGAFCLDGLDSDKAMPADFNETDDE